MRAACDDPWNRLYMSFPDGPPPSYRNRIEVFCDEHCPSAKTRYLARLELAPRGQEWDHVIKPMIDEANGGKEY